MQQPQLRCLCHFSNDEDICDVLMLCYFLPHLHPSLTHSPCRLNLHRQVSLTLGDSSVIQSMFHMHWLFTFWYYSYVQSRSKARHQMSESELSEQSLWTSVTETKSPRSASFFKAALYGGIAGLLDVTVLLTSFVHMIGEPLNQDGTVFHAIFIL